jgi:hypothetical protein
VHAKTVGLGAKRRKRHIDCEVLLDQRGHVAKGVTAQVKLPAGQFSQFSSLPLCGGL